jgi:DNA-directed RNA polymerase specialized sigma24 family protein
MGSWTDSQLMTQFLAGQKGSEAAFRMLHRHGPTVLGVCRRIWGDEHTAEAAFQATFLVLMQKAGTLRDRDLLTNWLYAVTVRVASRERGPEAQARRRVVETERRPQPRHTQKPTRRVACSETRRLRSQLITR